jgi:putative addiction module killer protein
MLTIRKTAEFARWAESLRDGRAEARVAVRIRRLADGNPGDVKPIGGGISEQRIDYGPGYRVYFVRRGSEIIVLLGGGTKKTQSRDIKAAKALAETLEDE